ncbi:MAG TPA: PaaI family thioesterase [Candidatus Sulfotelmatobacter sp.]|nr:PaaI family thioesterase [Candidatus Sulfotelmatobacter sp.]
MPTFLENIEKIVKGERPPAPVQQLIGFHLKSVRQGESMFEMETSSKHANPMGTLHGGILCDIADAAMGVAFASTLDHGESFTTLELKINFLRPVWNENIRAVGKVVKRGKTVGLIECDVTNAKGDLVARAVSTCMVLRGDEARGR